MDKETKKQFDEWIDRYIAAKRAMLMMLEGFRNDYSEVTVDGNTFKALSDIATTNNPLEKVHIYEGLDRLAEILGVGVKIEKTKDEYYTVKHSFVYRDLLFFELMSE